jgi:hypothetical protein
MLVAGKAEKGKDDVDRFMLVCLISFGYKNCTEFILYRILTFFCFFYQPR